MDKLAQLGTPVFWAEGHPGTLDRQSWEVEVTGLCREPKVFSWDELQKLPYSTADARLTSVTRWSVRGEWGGIKLSDLLQAVKADSNVNYIRFWSYGMKYDTSIPISTALLPETLLAWKFDDEYLTEDYGGPVRVFCPYLWGYKSAKSVIKIELLDHYIPGYWEKRGYTDSGAIEAGPMRDINDSGKIKHIPDGEVKEFK
ncbi:MAG TPA: molybdopterin-dependent oxidoreductase [Candidatus Cloacimonadota bacterium]|nr:molybdopterin-dependent oxidoreductase [Candidatus Cloacimonadota bacterium]HPT71026.1 molybdopterin-dependent oxidoreductase [Candidatus Cloacimonadota bacterium]